MNPRCIFTAFLFVLHIPVLAQEPALVLPQGHSTAPYIEFGKDEKLLLSVTDATILVWDVKYERILYNLSVPSKKILAARFNAAGDRVLLATTDSVCRIYDMHTGEVSSVLRFKNTKFCFANYNADKSRIISAHSDSTIVIWDAASSQVIETFKWHALPTYVVFDDDMQHAVITAETTRFDEVAGMEVPAQLTELIDLKTKHKRNAAGMISFIPALKAILYYDTDELYLENVSDGKKIAAFPRRYVSDYCLSGNKRFLAINDEVSVSVYDLVTGKRLSYHELENTGGVITNYKLYTFTDSNTRLLLSYYNQILSVNWKTGKTVLDGFTQHKPEPRDEDGNLPVAIDESTSGRQKAFSFPSGKIKIFQTADMSRSKTLEGKPFTVTGVLHNNHYNWLFSQTNYKTFNAWNLEAAKMVYSVTDSTFCANIYHFHFCEKGTILNVDACEGLGSRFRVKDGTLLHSESAREACYTDSSFIAGNRYYIPKHDPMMKSEWAVYHYDTGEKILSLTDSTTWVKNAVLSHDGNTAVVVWEDINFHSGINSFPYVDVWNVPSKKNWRINIPDKLVKEVVFSNNSRWFVLITKELNATLVDVQSRQQHYLGQYEYSNFINDSIVALSHQSNIVLYNFQKHSEIARLVTVDNGDYLIVLPGRYYSGNIKDLGKVHYVKNARIISFEQLDVKFNRPDLVLKAFGSKNTALINAYYQAYLKRLKKLEIDPALLETGYSVPDADFTNRTNISYEQQAGRLQLRFKASDSTRSLVKFNAWVNQVPVYGSRGIAIRPGRDFDTTFSIELSAGENRVEAAVTNASGIESYRMPLFVKYQPVAPLKEKNHFIGIGINQFADASNNLSWSVKDIRDLSLKLQQKYPGIIIDTLFDEQVTKENILALKTKLATLNVDDKVILSYSGHGILSKELDYYLSTYSIDFNEPEKNGLSYELFESLVDDIKPRKKLVLLDACHSGEVDKEEIERIEASRNALDSIGTKTKSNIRITPKTKMGMTSSFELMQTLFVNVSRGTGATVISAAGGMQYAQERGDLQNGVFTYSIIDAFNNSTTLTVSQLKKIVGESVMRLTNGLQKPTSRTVNNNFDWVVW